MDLLIGIAAGLIIAWALLVVLLWLLRPRGVSAVDMVRATPDVLRLLRALLADPTVPRRVRIALVGLLVWIVSPIDLIPEFVPVIGPLDDVILTVLVLRYVRRSLGIDALRERWPGSPEGFAALARLVGTDGPTQPPLT